MPGRSAEQSRADVLIRESQRRWHSGKTLDKASPGSASVRPTTFRHAKDLRLERRAVAFSDEMARPDGAQRVRWRPCAHTIRPGTGTGTANPVRAREWLSAARSSRSPA